VAPPRFFSLSEAFACDSKKAFNPGGPLGRPGFFLPKKGLKIHFRLNAAMLSGRQNRGD
jgi:hypothetical protein